MGAFAAFAADGHGADDVGEAGLARALRDDVGREGGGEVFAGGNGELRALGARRAAALSSAGVLAEACSFGGVSGHGCNAAVADPGAFADALEERGGEVPASLLA